MAPGGASPAGREGSESAAQTDSGDPSGSASQGVPTASQAREPVECRIGGGPPVPGWGQSKVPGGSGHQGRSDGMENGSCWQDLGPKWNLNML